MHSKLRDVQVALCQAAIWFITLYIANLIVWVSFGLPARFDSVESASRFFGDRNGWGLVVSDPVSTLLPLGILAFLNIRRIPLTWRLGLAIGLCIAFSQYVVNSAVALSRHMSIFGMGWRFYLIRLFTELPPPFLASFATKVFDIGSREEA